MARRFVITLLLLVAGGLLWFGATRKADPPEPSALDTAIEFIVPVQGTSGVLRQAPISIDLAAGWTGVLLINGVEIPEDQLDRNDPLNQISFQPGPGKEIEQLRPGRVVATAIIWRPLLGETRAEGARSFTWEFQVA